MKTFSEFVQLNPDYLKTLLLDDLRATDFARLDEKKHVYLDYTGAGLHAAPQVREHTEYLNSDVAGNPHSASPSSMSATSRVERTRNAVLKYFNGTNTYTAIFTLNASAAIKLVAESFPFEDGSQLLLTADNHNSINGIREFARAKGADIKYSPINIPSLRLDHDSMDSNLNLRNETVPNLLAFPAQSNFSGVKHPLDLVQAAQDKGWSVLLDAAAFVPTNRLDLQTVSPDFVALSFYKMFGYPTGVGCLLVRNSSLGMLKRPWFSGGTVNFATVQGQMHVMSPGEAGFEDGTLNFHSIPAVGMGLAYIERIGIEVIQTRVQCLTNWLLHELLEMRHSNGRALVRIYGPTSTAQRGGTVTMNFYDMAGHLLDYRRLEELAGAEGISLRTGCFCNPGAGELAEGLTLEDMRAAAALGSSASLSSFMKLMETRGEKSAGAI